MMNTFALCVGVLLMLASSRGLALGQPTNPAAERRPVEAYATEPLSPSVAELPANYAGHSCIAMATALKAAKLQKDEFETTDAYAKRLQAARTTPLVGAVTVSDEVAFAPPWIMVLQSYNADTRTLEAEIAILGNTFIDGPPLSQHDAAVIEILETKRDTYSATNRYGATVSVNRTSRSVCGAVFRTRRYATSPRIKASFQIDADEAKAVKLNMGVLFVGTLSEPYLVPYRNRYAPTITTPSDTSYTGDGIVMNLKQVWFFNRATGKVYARVDGTAR